MDVKYVYFDIEHAIQEHDYIIEISGGMEGINNIELLNGALNHIQNDGYYPEFIDKLTHLFYSINKNHAFADGNKRSSIVLSAYFLEINGYGYVVQQFISEMENITVAVAANFIDKDLLGEIISSVIYEEDYSEELKLKLLNALVETRAHVEEKGLGDN